MNYTFEELDKLPVDTVVNFEMIGLGEGEATIIRSPLSKNKYLKIKGQTIPMTWKKLEYGYGKSWTINSKEDE